MASIRDEGIPDEIRLIAAFINTVDLENGIDEIGTPEALAGWLSSQGLLDGPTAPSAAEHALALRVRESLRDLVERGAEDACIDRLNDAAAGGRLVVSFDDGGTAHLHAAAPGAAGALGRIMAAVFKSMVAQTWPRLKICKMHSCRWAFYDTSKNRSGTWCSMKVCGNRAKVRTYRKRAEAATGS